MLLYLFYNTDLLDIAHGKSEVTSGYVDNISIYAEEADFKDTHRKLWKMMKKKGGGNKWLKLHNSKFKNSKLRIVDFITERTHNMHNPGKTMPVKQKKLTLNGIKIQHENHYKCLGVLVDQQLDWKAQTASVTAQKPE